MNSRNGWSFTVKLTMWTDAIKTEGEDFAFNKVEGFVNFQPDPYERMKQLSRQVYRKIEFYQKLYDIKVTNYDFEILGTLEVELLPYTPLPIREVNYEQDL